MLFFLVIRKSPNNGSSEIRYFRKHKPLISSYFHYMFIKLYLYFDLPTYLLIGYKYQHYLIYHFPIKISSDIACLTS